MLALAAFLRYRSVQKRRCTMTLGIRKLIVIGIVGSIFLAANIMIVAGWLHEHGVVDFVKGIREEFVTGTAITIIIALLILLVKPRVTMNGAAAARGLAGRRCPVCDGSVSGSAKYCPDCGSKV